MADVRPAGPAAGLVLPAPAPPGRLGRARPRLTGKFNEPIVVAFALFTLAVATLSVNVAANIVSPSYDFSNAWPRRISFRTGGLITGAIGILIQPWNLYNDPHACIFTWLGTYGGATGAIAGVLIADYWWIRRTRLSLADLYKPSGIYAYVRGWNWRAVVALAIGIVFAIGGSYTAPGTDGPSPRAGSSGSSRARSPSPTTAGSLAWSSPSCCTAS